MMSNYCSALAAKLDVYVLHFQCNVVSIIICCASIVKGSVSNLNIYIMHDACTQKQKAGKVILLEDLFLTEHSIARAHSFALHVPHADNKRE